MLDYSNPDAAQGASSGNTEAQVIRDVWVFTGLLTALLAVIGALLSGGSVGMVVLVFAICTASGAMITWLAHIEFATARKNHREPRITRIFG